MGGAVDLEYLVRDKPDAQIAPAPGVPLQEFRNDPDLGSIVAGSMPIETTRSGAVRSSFALSPLPPPGLG